jgi:hypothetical protein
MSLKRILLLLLCFIAGWACAQFPANGIKLNQTQVMFEVPSIPFPTVYRIEIIEDTGFANFSNPFISQSDTTSATLINGLKFGKRYQWRYCAGLMDRPSWKGPFKFEISSIESLGRDSFKVTVLKNDSAKHAGGLIAADIFAIVDRNGEPVWYLPKRKEIYDGLLRDLRLTSAGTVTFLSGLPYAKAYECDLQGNILWQAPDDGQVSGDSSEFYHHEFQRLPDGHYLIAGNKFVWKKIPAWFIAKVNERNPGEAKRLFDVSPQMVEVNKRDSGAIFTKIQFATIIEYNRNGEVVWSWNSEAYFNDKEVFTFGGFEETPLIIRDAHLNAFSVDAENEFVYAGFKDINRLVKINMQSGKVVAEWKADWVYPLAEAFYHQHGASLSADGELLVFDNSPPGRLSRPAKVLAFTQPTKTNETKIGFAFQCIFDSTIMKVDRGGNVDELPNKNLLVCMGMGLQDVKDSVVRSSKHMGKFFEVNRNEEVVWDAVVDGVAPPYRAHYTSSLYPSYFTWQVPDTLTGRASFTIYNEGSEPDSYGVIAYFIKTKKTLKLATGVIAPGSSMDVLIDNKDIQERSDFVELIVVSKSKPALSKRKLVVFMNK